MSARATRSSSPPSFLLASTLASLALAIAGAGTAQSRGDKTDVTDQVMTQQAENACSLPPTQSAFRDFFIAFISSKAVREKYAAASVDFSVLSATGRKLQERVYDKADYPGPPIQMFEYEYRPVQPLRPGDKGERVEVEFNQRQSNDFSVE